jgi:hypothetical protein
MMMAIESLRLSAIQTVEFIDLRRYQVFEAAGQTRIIDYLRQAVPSQMSGQFALKFL